MNNNYRFLIKNIYYNKQKMKQNKMMNQNIFLSRNMIYPYKKI